MLRCMVAAFYVFSCFLLEYIDGILAPGIRMKHEGGELPALFQACDGCEKAPLSRRPHQNCRAYVHCIGVSVENLADGAHRKSMLTHPCSRLVVGDGVLFSSVQVRRPEIPDFICEEFDRECLFWRQWQEDFFLGKQVLQRVFHTAAIWDVRQILEQP